jgi:hypothetical protein
MRRISFIKITAYCASALLSVVLPTGIVVDVEPILQDIVSKFR